MFQRLDSWITPMKTRRHKNSEEKKITVDDWKTRHTAAAGSLATLLPSAAPPGPGPGPVPVSPSSPAAATRASSEKIQKEKQHLACNCTRRGKHSAVIFPRQPECGALTHTGPHYKLFTIGFTAGLAWC